MAILTISNRPEPVQVSTSRFHGARNTLMPLVLFTESLSDISHIVSYKRLFHPAFDYPVAKLYPN
jgi:hypothetical protein